MPARRATLTFFPLTVSRSQLMAALLIIASVNGLAPFAIDSVTLEGWEDAIFKTFNVSVIVWGASASACYLALHADDINPVRRPDLIIACFILLIIALPMTLLSWLSLSVLSAYAYWISPKHSLLRRSAIIFFAMCVPMLWGPILFAVAQLPLLNIDAFLVGALIGTKRDGNLVSFVDGIHSMQIWAACSSFHNISQAALAWVALSQTLGRGFAVKDMFWGGLAVALAAGVNLVRLCLMAVSPEYFQAIHGPMGAQFAGGLTIVLIAFVCIVGQRRELFAHA